jgi:outer membrane receptor for ferrienterochelin and colicins
MGWPQLNCNVCNTGDIHINGLEGPYTLVLIDGMPIVSGLSTVYGLSGIPNSLLERIEIKSPRFLSMEVKLWRID